MERLFFLLLLTVAASYSYGTPQKNPESAPDFVTIVKSEYTTCAYSDQDGRATPATLYKIPKVNCGAVSFAAEPPKALCEAYVQCAASGRPTLIFHAHGFSARCFRNAPGDRALRIARTS